MQRHNYLFKRSSERLFLITFNPQFRATISLAFDRNEIMVLEMFVSYLIQPLAEDVLTKRVDRSSQVDIAFLIESLGINTFLRQNPFFHFSVLIFY